MLLRHVIEQYNDKDIKNIGIMLPSEDILRYENVDSVSYDDTSDTLIIEVEDTVTVFRVDSILSVYITARDRCINDDVDPNGEDGEAPILTIIPQ